MDKKDIDPIKVLKDRIDQCVDLFVPEDKANDIKQMIERAVSDLLDVEFKDKNYAKVTFDHFANKTLSIIEILDIRLFFIFVPLFIFFHFC